MKSCIKKQINVCIKNFDVDMVIIDDNYYRYYRCVSPTNVLLHVSEKLGSPERGMKE